MNPSTTSRKHRLGALVLTFSVSFFQLCEMFMNEKTNYKEFRYYQLYTESLLQLYYLIVLLYH